MKGLPAAICKRLGINDVRFVEIESKKRVLPEDIKSLRKYLHKQKKVRHEKTSSFFDQFLDTADMQLLKLGASLRIRYKNGGERVYLQYKGPGFVEGGILFRSEFSSENLKSLLLEESRHDVIHFSDASVRTILARHVHPSMAKAMRRHLGIRVFSRITHGHFICAYKKEKFTVDLGKAFLEPSLDRVFAFHINRTGLHPLSSFYELENEIKSHNESLERKLEHIPDLLDFDARLADRFDLKAEPLDKYHRCGSIFLRGK